MNTKQTPENNILTKLITSTTQLPVGTIAKLFEKKSIHNYWKKNTEQMSFETKTAIWHEQSKSF